MLLQITHDTRYDYQPAVEIAQHMAYLKPRSHTSQSVLDFRLEINPLPASLQYQPDVFGNERCFFSLQVPHSTLSVTSHSLIATQPSESVVSRASWESVRDALCFRAGQPFDASAEYLFASPYVPRHPQFSSYAQPSFAPGGSLLDAALDLMHRIHQDFTYASQSTQINTPALQALAQRKGVCQDFAHIMIACFRSMGLPARYVSGYLLTQPRAGEARLLGSDASHAWVSVCLPDLPEGARWCDFDPTNDRWGWHAPGPDYVTLAIGRDFGDVSPLRGVIHGGASHILTVGVTVLPISGAEDMQSMEPMEPMEVSAESLALQTQSQYQGQSQGSGQSQSQTQSQSQSQTQSQDQSQN